MNEAQEFLGALRRNGHVRDPHAQLVPLSGGVSSEIYVVHDGTQKFVVKRALAKLKVKDNWFANVERNVSERDYIEYVGKMTPGAVPRIYFSCPDEGYFGMEFLDDSFINWKTLLLEGVFCVRHAELAGALLGEIHCRTTGNDFLRNSFDTTANFHQLRVEPYLITTGSRHPTLQAIFAAEAQRIEETREALVHGDFSPKNILIHDDRIVLLDCEVAWYGDPSFDVAFLLNHLFLKALYHAPAAAESKNMVGAFWSTYEQKTPEESATQITARLVPLLLMLLLARVDGKSPVEYLDAPKQEFIRSFVYEYLSSPPQSISELCDIWFKEISRISFNEVNL